MRFPPFLTSYIQILNVIVTVIASIVCYALLFAGYIHADFIGISVFILFSLILFFFLIFFYIFVKKGNTSKKTVLRIFVLIALCGIVEKVVMFLIRYSDLVVLYYCFTFFNVISACLFIPVHSSIEKFRISDRSSYIIYSVVGELFLGVEVYIVSLEQYDEYEDEHEREDEYEYEDEDEDEYEYENEYEYEYEDEDEDEYEYEYECEYEYEYEYEYEDENDYEYEYEDEDLKLKLLNQHSGLDKAVSRDVGPSAPVEELEDRQPQNQTLNAQTDKLDDSRPANQRPVLSECPICTNGYSDTTIPRILTQCGHTVCEECARKLLGDQGHITCPVCRKVTRVDGTVKNLPKNFAVIEMTRGNLNA